VVESPCFTTMPGDPSLFGDLRPYTWMTICFSFVSAVKMYDGTSKDEGKMRAGQHRMI
jgi:hypothetical protein